MPPAKNNSANTASPSPQEVDAFHKYADTDKRSESIHHTIGRGPGQVSDSRHTHDGTTSALLFDNAVISGSRSTQLANIVNDLLNVLQEVGIQNGTTL